LNDPVSNIDVDGLSSVNPLLQMLQCQGVVLHESIKIGLTQAISSLANGFAQNLQQKNTTQQAGKQGGAGNTNSTATQRSLDDPKSDPNKNNEQVRIDQPKPAPESLKAFPDALPIRSRGRDTWKSKSGIYEWDYKKGEVEVYDKTGKEHLGGFDPETGRQRSPRKPGRISDYAKRIESLDYASIPSVVLKVIDRLFSRLLGPFIVPESVLKPSLKYTPSIEL
jgi:Cytotoxic